MKKITSYDQLKNEVPIVEEQAEIIADKFAKIQNEYEPLQTEDISVPSFDKSEIPVFNVAKVWLLQKLIQINLQFWEIFQQNL